MSGKTFHASSVVFDGTQLFVDAARSLSKPNPRALAACLENARTFGCVYPPVVERGMADVLERALDLRPVVAPLFEAVLRRYPDVRPLAPGWQLRRSGTRRDQYYYAHEASGRTSWERPPPSSPDPTPPAAAGKMTRDERRHKSHARRKRRRRCS